MTEPCPECRFDPGAVADVAGEIEALGRKFAAPLTRFLDGEDGAALLRRRPEPEAWSALEYACHVRDVLELFEDRVQAVAASPGIRLGWWDHERAAADGDYASSDPSVVADQIAAACISFASTLRSLTPEQRLQVGERRPGEVLTATELAVFALHEAKHHQLDIGRTLRAARGR